MSRRDRLIRWVCERVAARLPVRVIRGVGGTPYLSKYALRGGGRDGVSIHLHRFHRGDEDKELHNHPWAWAASLVLAGGYTEERLIPATFGPSAIATLDYAPGATNFIGPDTFHRVDLRDGECWTLFVTGRIVQSWGFLRRGNLTYVPWREFLKAKGVPIDEPWRKEKA